MLTHSETWPTLRIERVRYPHGNLLVVIGEVDVATVGILDACLAGIPPAGDVLMDLSEVSFLGASGMRLLLRWAGTCHERGQVFSVCALRPQHRRLLERLDVLDELVHPEAHLRFPEAPPHAD